jgi:hypothetical protein
MRTVLDDDVLAAVSSVGDRESDGEPNRESSSCADEGRDVPQ